MSTIIISDFFKQKYVPEDWRSLLSSIFSHKGFYQTPLEKKDNTLSKHSEVESIKEFGDFSLDDNSRILFYEIELKDGKSVTRNRVGLRNLIHTEVIPGDVDGILATYYNPKAKDWRLTFISKSLYWDEEMNEIKSETHPKRYTYVLGENESVKTAVKQFTWLLNLVHSREVSIDDLIKTFALEKISKEFFDGYRHNFESFEAYIIDNADAFNFFKKHITTKTSTEAQQEETERLVRNFAKKLLGRIVFIYFLQKKGWLGVPKDKPWGEGERDFMSKLFSNFPDKNNFYASCLVPLFFDTLNSERDGHIFAITDSKIPYLNGGLFDPDKIEPLAIKFDPQLFENLFAFFDQYNFTIDENSPDDFDIGIDPEMLGLIFENLLEDNRDKGTFYTPKEVVHFMCKESLSLHALEQLKNKATEEELKEIDIYIRQCGKFDSEVIRKHANALDYIFSKVKICDPAIGSGAFPMGMVYEILRLKKELFGYLPKTSFDYRKVKLDIIRNSIYGVDINKGAVDIARLRFWLSLIVDEEEPSPLPNLEYKIMQGNSLKEYFEDIPLDQITWSHKKMSFGHEQLTLLGAGFDKPQKEIEFTIDEKEQLKKWVSEYFIETDRSRKEELHRLIDEKVIKHIEKNVEIKSSQITELKKEIEKKYKESGVDIASQTKGKDYKNWFSLKKSLSEFEQKKEKIKSIQENTERPWFLWNLFFGDVLLEGNKGFDIVIGNPPYGVPVDDEIQNSFKLGSKDSYGVFMSMALKKLVKPNGVLSFIVSDTWLTIKSHFQLREQILNYELKKIIRLHQDCFKATVNSCIFTLQKSKSESSSNTVIAADFTNISTRKEIPEFRDKLFHLEIYKGDYSPKYAVYQYPQNLLLTNSSKPVIVGSPKLFQLMNDVTCSKEIIKIEENNIEFEIRKIIYNDCDLSITKFGEIADVKQGLATGDNKYHLFQNPEARGTYRDINLFRKYLLSSADLESIVSNESIRSKIVEKGFHQSIEEPDFDSDLWCSGKYIVPYDKGGESDTDEGWLPNYYVPTNYFIDWSTSSIKRMKTRTSAKQSGKIASRFQNKNYYFKKGISFSDTGFYAPTFRINNDGVFDVMGMQVIPFWNSIHFHLGILSSKLIRYIIKQFINHTVHTQVEGLKPIPYVIKESKEIENLVIAIIEKQSLNQRYNYLFNEQKEIDRLVYELFGLNADDINEVETWFARRYPKLASYAYYKPHSEIIADQTKGSPSEKIKAIIEAGENKQVEFKSSLRYCLKKLSAQPYIEHSSFKNLAAFLNTEGGTLLIGVEDNGNILGLESTDFTTFKGENKTDEFRKHFDNLVEKYFGNALSGKFELTFEAVSGKTIAMIEVKEKSSEPIILQNPEKGKEEFYIRRSASTVSLTMHEFYTYAKEHWKIN